MKINISARHFKLTESLEIFAKEKISRIEHYCDNILNCHIVLFLDNYLYVVEITVHGNHFTFAAKSKSKNMYASIDEAVDKLINQLKKYRSKQKKINVRKTKILKGGNV